MVQIRIIKAPSEGTRRILKHRINLQLLEPKDLLDQAGAIGLVQGSVIEMICAADVLEKTSDVVAVDIQGNCPQKLVTLGILGSVAAVEAALNRLKESGDY